MNVTAIPSTITFFPVSNSSAPAPAKAPAAFVPLMPDQADLQSQTSRILQMVQGGRVDTYV